jgi:Co/Zn/Cd efflux system component
MFLIEVGAGVAAGSTSLQADALDFDAANYAISLLVVGMVVRYHAIYDDSCMDSVLS